MNHPHALRLTPSNSPFFKNTTPKSPTKAQRSEEGGLRLKKVIGTTTETSNGFDCLPSAKQFAYTAGAAAVVSTVRDDLTVSQRFFRARPSSASTRDGLVSPVPTNDLRSKLVGNLRDQSSASPFGASGRDWSDSPTGKSTTAKDRVKAATSVALSPNGKWVAVGETGYKPRILIFSNQGESSEAPVCTLAEHTFGVHALGFSPDSRYLASLGTVNDGFLYIWAIDDRTGTATLQASNKCTATINALTWVGRSVLTVGLRFVKLWKPDEEIADGRILDTGGVVLTPKQKDFAILSPKHRVLAGKNSILGDMIDANFVTAVALEQSNKAIVCAESGEICLLDDTDKTQTLTPMAMVGFRITAAMVDTTGAIHISGGNGQLKKFKPDELQERSPSAVKRERRTTMAPAKTFSALGAVTTTAMAKIDDTVVELDSRRGIRLTRSDDSGEPDADVASHQLAAHNDAVLGVQCLSCESLPEASFLTFAGNGSVHIWNADGTSVVHLQVPVDSSPEMYEWTNELKAVAQLPRASLLVAGDKYGTLSVLDISTGSILTQVRAHSTEIVDIVTFERSSVVLLATASRDRMIQLFTWQKQKLELLQTMDEHAAAVSGLAVGWNGNLLLSCSADRTIVVREAMIRTDGEPMSVAFFILRTITLRSSPTSMCFGADQDELLVSTVDRSIGKYSIKNGQAGFSFKCSDTQGGEAAAMSRILYAPSLHGNPTIIGVSSGDKSVRLYSEYGLLLARDWGHTEGISDVALLPQGSRESKSHAQLVTVAADSTVFMWDTVSQSSVLKEQTEEVTLSLDTPTTSKLTPMAPPLRKVLSYSELSRYKREKSVEEADATSPLPVTTPPLPPPSPPRLKKKSSRTSMAPPPKLEPAFRSSFSSARRKSVRKRSPSPPSPKASKKDLPRKPSLGMSLRSKSSENVLNSHASGTGSNFGSISSSTESVCRNLRAYRKRLALAPSETVSQNVLRDLATELKATARVVGELTQGKALDEATMAKLLDQASDRIVDRLEERIKSSEARRSSDVVVESPTEMDAVTSALGKVRLNSK